MAMKGNENITVKVGQMLGMEDKPKDAVDLLKADHRKVEALFRQFESARTKVSKQALVNQIIQELTVHATVEENLVYPILERIDKTEDGALEAEEEHHLLKLALAELADTPMTSKNLAAKVSVIKELVKHHVKEEERELLPQLKKNGTDLQQLATQIVQRKQQLLRGVARGGGIGKNKVQKAHATSSSKAKPARVRAVKGGKKRRAAA